MKKIRKLFRVYFDPIYGFLITAEIASFIIFLFYLKFSDEKLSWQLTVEGSLIFLSAFSGILIPILISRNWDKEKDRATLAFTLSLIWTELRINRYLLKDVIGNYKFEGLLTVTPISKMVDLVYHKHKATNSIIRELKNESFIASQSSRAISTFDSDELLNSIMQAYENTIYTQGKILSVTEELAMKYALEEIKTNSLNQAEIVIVMKQVVDAIQKMPAELEFTLKKVDEAVAFIEARLKGMGVNMEEIER